MTGDPLKDLVTLVCGPAEPPAAVRRAVPVPVPELAPSAEAEVPQWAIVGDTKTSILLGALARGPKRTGELAKLVSGRASNVWGILKRHLDRGRVRRDGRYWHLVRTGATQDDIRAAIALLTENGYIVRAAE